MEEENEKILLELKGIIVKEKYKFIKQGFIETAIKDEIKNNNIILNTEHDKIMQEVNEIISKTHTSNDFNQTYNSFNELYIQQKNIYTKLGKNIYIYSLIILLIISLLGVLLTSHIVFFSFIILFTILSRYILAFIFIKNTTI